MAQTATIVAMPGSDAARLAATGVLLKQPKYNGLPDHDMVYALRGGRVKSFALARYRLPESLRDTIAIIPSCTNTEGLAMLPVYAAMLDRMAPWLQCHVVPRAIRADSEDSDFAQASGAYEVNGRLYRGTGGIACKSENLILLPVSSPEWMAYSLCHEVMHHLWEMLSQQAIDVLTAAVGGGMALPSNYHRSTEESVCRLFEAYCWQRMETEGADVRFRRYDGEMTAENLFEWFWSGAFADLMIGDDRVNVSAEVKAARGVASPAPAPTAPTLVSRVDAVVGNLVVAGWNRIFGATLKTAA